MRRWQKFGCDSLVLQKFTYGSPKYWRAGAGSLDDVIPCWIFHQHKQNTFEVLVKAYGQANANEAIYLQTLRATGSYIDPAPDCLAQHITIGFEAIGGTAPLGTFLFNGFMDRNFQSTPPIYTISTVPPLDDPNG